MSAGRPRCGFPGFASRDAGCAVMAVKPASRSLELGIVDPKQLFNSMDPAPFHERDLDPDVIDYIVEWAQDLAPEAPLELVVTLHQAAATGYDAALISSDDLHFALVIFSRDCRDDRADADNEGAVLVARLAKQVYDHFRGNSA